MVVDYVKQNSQFSDDIPNDHEGEDHMSPNFKLLVAQHYDTKQPGAGKKSSLQKGATQFSNLRKQLEKESYQRNDASDSDTNSQNSQQVSKKQSKKQ